MKRRSRTLSLRRAPKRLVEEAHRNRGKPRHPDASRTRADCIDGPRPCPWCGETVRMGLFNVQIDRSNREAIWETIGAIPLRFTKTWIGNRAGMVGMVRLRGDEISVWSEPSPPQGNELRLYPAPPRTLWNARIRRMGFDDRPLRKSPVEEILRLRCEGDNGVSEMASKLSFVFGAHGLSTVAESLDRPHRQRRQLRAWQLSVGDKERAGTKQTHIACPNCAGPVSHVGGVGGEDWHWTHYDPSKTVPGMDRGARHYHAGMNHCRPCVWTACRHHLYCDINYAGGLVINHKDRDPWELPDTCVLDVADRGGVTLEQAGDAMGLTRERTRQIEKAAVEKLRRKREVRRLEDAA